MSRKSLAIVLPELLPVPPVQGGAVEHWVHEVSQRLDAEVFDIRIVSRPAGVASPAPIRNTGIAWTHTEKRFQQIKDRVSWRNPLRYVCKLQNVWSYGRRAAAAVRDADIIYLHNEPNLLQFIDKQAGQKIVLHMHNDHLSIRLFRSFYRRVLHKADVVLCVSDYIRRCALAHLPEHAHRFHVLYNATDPAMFKPVDDARARLGEGLALEADAQHVLYVGRLTALKGVHVLIKAFAAVRRQHPAARLIITGSSFFGGATRTAYEDELVRLADPIKDAIVFTGFLPHERLRYLYSAVDVVCLPSVWQDPCPLVVLEAMACGTCLVTTQVGGIPEVMEDRVTGRLVPPDDETALAIALGEALSAPGLRRQWAGAAREKIVAGYDWSRLVNELSARFGALQ